MLKHLYISNYALIDELDIDFPAGFSVITGETGAGKSIILGALGMILGNRADIKAIKPGAKKCVIEAVFDVTGYGLEPLFADGDVDFDASECIVRRELSATGKSRSSSTTLRWHCNSSASSVIISSTYTRSTRICCYRRRISSSVSSTL